MLGLLLLTVVLAALFALVLAGTEPGPDLERYWHATLWWIGAAWWPCGFEPGFEDGWWVPD